MLGDLLIKLGSHGVSSPPGASELGIIITGIPYPPAALIWRHTSANDAAGSSSLSATKRTAAGEFGTFIALNHFRIYPCRPRVHRWGMEYRNL